MDTAKIFKMRILHLPLKYLPLWLTLSTFIVLALFFLTGCSSSEPNPQESIKRVIRERAVESDKANTHQASLKLYAVLRDLEPENISNHIAFIGAARKSGDKAAFIQYLDNPVSTSRANFSSEYVIEVIFTMVSFNLIKRAENFLNINKDIIDSEATFFWLKGAIEMGSGEYFLALRSYESCLRIEPNNEPCRFDLNSLISKGKYENNGNRKR
jgi:tetratricopeptide (TPR) repeat protein